jgi:cobalt-zinc-cadmium efflux system outer membrane protein
MSAEAAQAGGRQNSAELDQLKMQRHVAALALAEAEMTLRSNKRGLGALLNLPREHAESLQLRGLIRDEAPPPPPIEELTAASLANRPDLVAFRLGVGRAVADVQLAEANRIPDVFVLYQPLTYQDNSPFQQPSSRSWALGATVAVPLFDRNQGNIRRARVNVDQTRLELRALERKAVTAVEDAAGEYTLTRLALERIERDMLPPLQMALERNLQLYRQGQADVFAYAGAQRDYNDVARQYREMLVRHRRSMLDLNTAVGERILP